MRQYCKSEHLQPAVSVMDIPKESPVVESKTPVTIKVYKRRLWIQFLFSFTTMLCGILFSEYVATANVTSCFYGVSDAAVNWTTMIWMVVYIVLIFPASSFFDYLDVRGTVLGASVFNTAACIVQFLTLEPGRFTYVMISSFLASMSNLFILSVPPVLAAKWFPENELSRSCAFGVFGNQLGIALGFILNPLLVSSDCSNKELIGADKFRVTCILTSLNSVILILIIFTFQNSPKYPPSLNAAVKDDTSKESHYKVVLSMLKNVNFLLVLLVNGLLVGSYFALSTVLNEMILLYFPNQEVAIGWMGLLLIVLGLLGSVIAGYILDLTNKFKEVTFGMCLATLVSCILFCSLLYIKIIWVQFITISCFGFFLTGFLPVGFEYGIEVTYPLSENVSACLINSSAMVIGLILIPILTYLLTEMDPIYSSITFIMTYLVCCIITCFITKEYKRSQSCINEKDLEVQNKA